MKKYDISELSSSDDWSVNDEVQINFLKQKYSNRNELLANSLEKRKYAEKNRLKEDGSQNPKYILYAMEAELATMASDMSFVIMKNNLLEQQVDILSSLYERVMLLEGAYSYLRQSNDHARDMYKESVKRHADERQKWKASKQDVVTGQNKLEG